MQITKWNGKPIRKPGWYSGIPIERYHDANLCAGMSVSSTDLRTCWAKSPAHMFVNWCENPEGIKRKETRAMTLGAAAHHLFLGEDGYNAKFVVQPATYRDKVTAVEKPWHGGATPCKQWVEKQKKAGRTIVTQAETELIKGMARSLVLEPFIDQGILRGHVEMTGIFKDQQTGLWIKVRPDVVPTDSGDFCDLKTAIEVTDVAIQSSIRSYGYHQQAALVWEACEALGTPWRTFVLMFIETAPPHCARAVPLMEDDMSRGRLQNRAMLRKIASCLIENHWPGPGEGDPRPLPLATDERSRIDHRLKAEGILT
jgi:hypothetical protein